MSTRTTTLPGKATEMGAERGKAQGSWVIDGNTQNSFCEKLIQGYEAGDPEIMDLCPSCLSGEFADDPTPNDVFVKLGIKWDHNQADALLDHYEDAFQSSWWATVLNSCYKQLGFEPCGVCGNFGHKWKDHD